MGSHIEEALWALTLTGPKRGQQATNNARYAMITAKKDAEALEAKYYMLDQARIFADGCRLLKLKQDYDDCKTALDAARTAEEFAHVKYIQTISRTFTTAFLSALPRELRDHVYSYLWDDEDIIRQTKRSVREYAWSYRMPEFCAPTYVQPSHVGRIVAEELALSIYKRAFGVKLHVTISAGHIHKFLAANPLRSSLKPADCIKALDIEWYPNEYSDNDVARSFRDLEGYNFPQPIAVKLILGKFTAVVEGGSYSTVVPENRLAAFKPAFHALVRRHCLVTVESLSGHKAEVDFFSRD